MDITQNGQPREQGSREVALNENVAVMDPMEQLKSKYGLTSVSSDMKLPEVRWIVSGLLEEASPMTVLGTPKLGKTWMTLSLGLSVATGHPFLGRKVNVTGPVVYFTGEGHLSKTVERIKAILKRWGKTLDDIEGKFFITTRRIHIGGSNEQNDIAAIIKDIKPVLVVFDPLARFLVHESEDKVNEMRPIIDWVQFKLCGSLKTAVAIAHHTTKDGRSARGSGDIFGFVATQVRLTGTPGGLNTVETILRNAESPANFRMRLDTEVEEVNGDPVLIEAELVIEGAQALPPRDQHLIGQAREILGAAGEKGVSVAEIETALAVGWDKARKVLIASGAIQRAANKRWYDSTDPLVANPDATIYSE